MVCKPAVIDTLVELTNETTAAKMLEGITHMDIAFRFLSVSLTYSGVVKVVASVFLASTLAFAPYLVGGGASCH